MKVDPALLRFVRSCPEGTRLELWRGDQKLGSVARQGKLWMSTVGEMAASFDNRGIALLHAVEAAARLEQRANLERRRIPRPSSAESSAASRSRDPVARGVTGARPPSPRTV